MKNHFTGRNVFADQNQFTRDFDGLMEAISPTKFECALAEMVHGCYVEARDHKHMTGVTECLEMDLRARRGVYNPDELARLEPNENVYYPITSLKIQSGEAWMTDIYNQTEETLFTIEPTPIPDILPELEAVALRSLQEEVTQAGIDGENIERISREIKDITIDHQRNLAMQATANHKRLIDDQIEDGKFRHVFRDFRSDLMTYKSAIIKGPILRPIVKKMYDLNGNPTEVRKIVPVAERVSPFDFFPSPDATGPQPDDSAYIIHRKRVCKRDFWKLTIMDGVSIPAINKVLSTDPDGHYDIDRTDEMSLGHIHKDTTNEKKTPFFELINYYGRVSGRMLLDHANIKGVHPNYDYEAHIIVSGGIVIRAILNPQAINMRPFHVTSYMKNNDGIWGTSVPQRLRDVQRKANGSVRAMVKNMAYSSGFIAEADVERLKDEEDITDMSPYRLWLTAANRGNTSPVLRIHQIQSTAPQLIQLQQLFQREADDLSGIPAYVLGNAGTSAPPRTTGVLALLLGAAARGIKHIISNIDKDIMEPFFTMVYHLNMCESNDSSIKADASVKARGASGIVEKDLKQSRKLEFLQIISNFPNVQPEGLDMLARSFAEDFGFDPNIFIPDPDRAALVQQRAGVALGTSIVDADASVLDGRNAPVVEAALGNQSLPI